MPAPFIEFKDVKKQFGSLAVLKGVNLSISKGTITVVIGKSGTGKSVLLKHIVGLIREDEGQVLIQGEPLNQLPKEKARQFKKSMSYMFQDNALFDFLTAYENIALPLKETTRMTHARIREKVHNRMAQLSIEGNDHKYPSELSGGMRKRVALARALVTDPEVILFDEPTTGLDPVRKNDVHHMIKGLQDEFGFTAVIVSHDIPDIFDLAQQIALLDDGIIVFEGTRQEIMDCDIDTVRAFIRGRDAAGSA
ncbi:MAG TPA: ATP-binding cassette domain-containing protein [Desulfotignum sp.]|nr:ATP-binding cassette domain-containing protein [Desulfotignum sp.]